MQLIVWYFKLCEQRLLLLYFRNGSIILFSEQLIKWSLIISLFWDVSIVFAGRGGGREYVYMYIAFSESGIVLKLLLLNCILLLQGETPCRGDITDNLAHNI